MNSGMRRYRLLSLLAVISFSVQALVVLPAHAKVWSIDERQLQLMQDINQAQKQKKLTDKEAKKLREQLANVARKKRKFQKGDSQSKNFSDAQKAELGAELDKVRADIKKFEVEKETPKEPKKKG